MGFLPFTGASCCIIQQSGCRPEAKDPPTDHTNPSSIGTAHCVELLAETAAGCRRSIRTHFFQAGDYQIWSPRLEFVYWLYLCFRLAHTPVLASPTHFWCTVAKQQVPFTSWYCKKRLLVCIIWTSVVIVILMMPWILWMIIIFMWSTISWSHVLSSSQLRAFIYIFLSVSQTWQT